MSTPQTRIYVCSGVPLNNRYDHTLYFNSPETQEAYFYGKHVKVFNNYAYVRRTWKLKLAATMEAARVWSYLYFANGTNAKTYYYFINSVEYVNDSTVELSLELDVMQTYMFDWTIRPCYVEREHSVTDNIGENTVNEGLETGDFISQIEDKIDLSSNLLIMTAATATFKGTFNWDDFKFDTNMKQAEGKIYDKIFSGYHITAKNLTSDYQEFATALKKIGEEGQLDAITSMWVYPSSLVMVNENSDYDYLGYDVVGSKSFEYETRSITGGIDGYTPKNKKLYQYPYRFLYVTNNAGSSAVYRYEYFEDESGIVRPKFKVSGNISPDAVVKLTPLNYKGVPVNNDEAFSMGGFPLCPWTSDTYKMWLAQSQNQRNLTSSMGALSIVGGVGAAVASLAAAPVTGGLSTLAGGAGVGMIASGMTTIATQNAQMKDMEIQPPQARGVQGSSHNVSNSIQNFEFYHKTIDAYHAQIIDDFFTMYGYACRKVKVPNISSRPSFNYVKTVGSNVTGNFCMEDIKQINAIFDRGITFWKKTDIGNYAHNNSPT